MPNESNVRQLLDHGVPIYPLTDKSLVLGLQDVPFEYYVVAWDGASTPVPANIPAGVVVTYNGTDYTGTLAAGSATAPYLYLVASASQPGEYDRYITTHPGSSYVWTPLGSTAPVSPVIADDLVTNDSSKALSAKQGKILNDKTSELEAKLIHLTGFGTNANSANATNIGDIYYNTSSKLLRKVVALSPNNEVTVSYVDAAIYTMDGDFYIWDGSNMVVAPSSLWKYIKFFNASIFSLPGTSLSKTGTTNSTSGFVVSPFIPVSEGETIRVGGYSGGSSYNYSLLCLYDSDKTFVGEYGNGNGDGYKEHEMTIPSGVAYIRVGSRNDYAGVMYLSKSYVDARVLNKLFDAAGAINDLRTAMSNVLTAFGALEDTVEDVADDVSELDAELLTGVRTLNNIRVDTGGKITFDAITLSQDGDELYFEALPDSTHDSQNNGGYPFTFGSPEDKIRVGLPYCALCLRSDDNTWIYGPAGGIGDETTYNPKKVKIKYTGGNIEIYAMGVLKDTYIGQKTVTIYGIGSQTMTYGKWSGYIYKFAYTHNGVTTDLLDLPGYTKNEYVTENYDVTPGRVPALEHKVSQMEEYINPRIVVTSTSSQVDVYQKIRGNLYLRFSIYHNVNTSDTAYTDYWRIGPNSNPTAKKTGEFCTYQNGVFTGLGLYPVNYAENEFAIQFYSNDFTGGVHGNERIDLDPSCYIVFIVDGKEYTIAELNALGTVSCDKFSYREKSFFYSMYSVTETHDKIAEHIKITEFKDGGYVTNNHIKMESAMTVRTAYSGLVCAYKDCADFVVDNNGTVFTMNHPSSSTQVSSYKNDTNFKTRMFKGDLSCHFDSRVVGGNVASYKNANPNVAIWDRQYDTKYYAMMPTSVAVSANDVFEFECTAKWDYRETE